MRYHVPRFCVATTLLLCSTSLAGRSLAAPHVAVIGLSFSGEVTGGKQLELMKKVHEGLAGAGLQVISEQASRQALGSQAPGCTDAACWKMVASKLGCRFLVGGSIQGEDRSYMIELHMVDGRTGQVAAQVHSACNICGLKAVAEKIELAASALRAKLLASAKAPARLLVESDPPGASLAVDGEEVGLAPREIELAAGTHTITAKSDGFIAATRTVSAVSGVNERLTIRLLPVPTSSTRKVAGWVVAGAGLASLGLAAALFALDGDPVGCQGEEQFPGGQCPEQVETSAGAWVATSVGAVAVAAGAYLLYSGYRVKRPHPARSASLRPSPLGLSGSF
jgi:hypothetical protein